MSATEYAAERRARLKKAGWCINGKKHGRPSEGHTKCDRCLGKPEKQLPVCVSCESAPALGGAKSCTRCISRGHLHTDQIDPDQWHVCCQAYKFHRSCCETRPTRGPTVLPMVTAIAIALAGCVSGRGGAGPCAPVVGTQTSNDSNKQCEPRR